MAHPPFHRNLYNNPFLYVYMELLNIIRAKKELRAIDATLIEKVLSTYAQKHCLSLEKLSPSEVKILVADIRKELRLYTGRFHYSSHQKEVKKLLEARDYLSLLKRHASTRERVPLYPQLLSYIHSLNPQIILDIGSGINLLACAQKGKLYYAYDINGEDLECIKQFAEQEKREIRCIQGDIRTIKAFPEADLALLFKIVDIIDTKGHKNATQLIRKLAHIPSILVSFATRSLSGKPFKTIRRSWFERLLQAEGYTYEVYSFPTECFYLARKENSRTSRN